MSLRLTIQVTTDADDGAVDELLAVLTHARATAKKMLSAGKRESVEEQWCSAAMRVTVAEDEDASGPQCA